MSLPKPVGPDFSSGPCAKRPGWTVAALNNATVGRSHRSGLCKKRIAQALDETRELLGIPDDYLIGIVPGSDTGAMEMAIWNLLGARAIDVLCWESFSEDWKTDVIKHLGLEATVHAADYGQLPDLSNVNFNNDVVFVWNGTTSGVCVPNADWIASDRDGLTICDATSAVFAMDLDWSKLDVVTYSWQKALGGEAGFGMMILSPRAIERLNTYMPSWPLPKLFRLRKGTQINEGIFKGETINTISMLCVEDYLDALAWTKQNGGLAGLIERSKNNLLAITEWVEQIDWIDFLADHSDYRSSTSVCLKISADWFQVLSQDEQTACMKSLIRYLEDEQVAYDINAYRSAPPGLRIWGGATVETSDLKLLFPWIEQAYAAVQKQFA